MGRGRGAWAHMPRRPMPCCIPCHHPSPCHITDPWDGLHTASPPLTQVGFDPKVDVELPHITGSTVIDSKGTNQPPNRHSDHDN